MKWKGGRHVSLSQGGHKDDPYHRKGCQSILGIYKIALPEYSWNFNLHSPPSP